MKKILIVEDNPKISLALSVRLRASGYETLTAFDAMSGLSMAVKQRPDLVILDISLPAGNGFIVAERIQNLTTTAGMPVLFITASSDPAFRERAEAMGAVAFIEKPFYAETLLVAIAQALGPSPAVGTPST